jgi:hypothetical protein
VVAERSRAHRPADDTGDTDDRPPTDRRPTDDRPHRLPSAPPDIHQAV